MATALYAALRQECEGRVSSVTHRVLEGSNGRGFLNRAAPRASCALCSLRVLVTWTYPQVFPESLQPTLNFPCRSGIGGHVALNWPL